MEAMASGSLSSWFTRPVPSCTTRAVPGSSAWQAAKKQPRRDSNRCSTAVPGPRVLSSSLAWEPRPHTWYPDEYPSATSAPRLSNAQHVTVSSASSGLCTKLSDRSRDVASCSKAVMGELNSGETVCEREADGECMPRGRRIVPVRVFCRGTRSRSAARRCSGGAAAVQRRLRQLRRLQRRATGHTLRPTSPPRPARTHAHAKGTVSPSPRTSLRRPPPRRLCWGAGCPSLPPTR
jgi:hypothetical protein